MLLDKAAPRSANCHQSKPSKALPREQCYSQPYQRFVGGMQVRSKTSTRLAYLAFSTERRHSINPRDNTCNLENPQGRNIGCRSTEDEARSRTRQSDPFRA